MSAAGARRKVLASIDQRESPPVPQATHHRGPAARSSSHLHQFTRPSRLNSAVSGPRPAFVVVRHHTSACGVGHGQRRCGWFRARLKTQAIDSTRRSFVNRRVESAQTERRVDDWRPETRGQVITLSRFELTACKSRGLWRADGTGSDVMVWGQQDRWSLWWQSNTRNRTFYCAQSKWRWKASTARQWPRPQGGCDVKVWGPTRWLCWTVGFSENWRLEPARIGFNPRCILFWNAVSLDTGVSTNQLCVETVNEQWMPIANIDIDQSECPMNLKTRKTLAEKTVCVLWYLSSNPLPPGKTRWLMLLRCQWLKPDSLSESLPTFALQVNNFDTTQRSDVAMKLTVYTRPWFSALAQARLHVMRIRVRFSTDPTSSAPNLHAQLLVVCYSGEIFDRCTNPNNGNIYVELSAALQSQQCNCRQYVLSDQ